MKKYVMMLATIMVLTLLVACGNDGGKDFDSSDGVEAKTGEEAVDASGDAVDGTGSTDKDDIWTYYENANWEGDFGGLETTIEKVVVTDEAPTAEDADAKVDAIGVKVKVDNTTDGKFVSLIGGAELVTSTGESLSADAILSDVVGGDMDKGVANEGDIYFFPKRGSVDDIEWVKLKWTETNESEMDNDNTEEGKGYINQEVELKLK